MTNSTCLHLYLSTDKCKRHNRAGEGRKEFGQRGEEIPTEAEAVSDMQQLQHETIPKLVAFGFLFVKRQI